MASGKWKNSPTTGKRLGKAGLQEQREPSRRQRPQLGVGPDEEVWGLIRFTEEAKPKRVPPSIVCR